MKKIYLSLLSLLIATASFGQTVAFSENFGTVTGTTQVVAHNGFQSSGLFSTVTGTNPVSVIGVGDISSFLAPDIRSTTGSALYSFSSAGANVFFTSNTNLTGTQARTLFISNINTSNIVGDVGFRFGFLKFTAGTDNLKLAYSTDNINFTEIVYSTTTATGWREVIIPDNTLPKSTSLTLLFFKQSSSVQHRIDDVQFLDVSTNANSSANSITGFTLQGNYPAVITGNMINVTVPNGTIITSLSATGVNSALSTVNPSFASFQNFSTLVNYTVTSQNLSTNIYSVSVTSAPAVQVGSITSIATLRNSLNSFGIPTITGLVSIAGQVYGFNSGGGTRQFQLVDATGAITLRSNVLPSTLAEGDLITVSGGFLGTGNGYGSFNGLLQMANIVGVAVGSTANPRKTPLLVSVLDESTESNFIKVIADVDPLSWTGAASFTSIITVAGMAYSIRINTWSEFSGKSFSTVFGTSEGKNVTFSGLGWQFQTAAESTIAGTNPLIIPSGTVSGFFGGYQLVPYKLSDLQLPVILSSANSITGFTLQGNYPAIITGNMINVTVPNGTNLTSLSATGINSALSTVNPSFANFQNFSTMVNYTVTSQNMMTNIYSVSVTSAPASTANSITGFVIANVAANIVGNMINVTVPNGTIITSLSATGVNSALSTVNPSFATLLNYSTAQTFTVTAQNMATNVYTVQVAVSSSLSPANTITGFTLQGNYSGVISGNIINVTVPFGTNLANLSASGTNSLVSTVSPSFATLLNYSTAQTFTVTAQNMATNVYTVQVAIAPGSSANSITGFTLQGNYAAAITGNMINVTVPFGTNLTSLSATGFNSPLSTVNPSFATLLNYSTAQTFTVTAQNSATNVYTVNVSVAPQVVVVVGDLFFSEYVEVTSGNAKYVEIFNPTPNAINLFTEKYSYSVYSNGATTVSGFGLTTLSGTIPAYGTYIVANTGSPQSGVTENQFGNNGFNGDDALALFKNGVIIDVIGQIGFRPTAEWVSGGISTLNQTLVRKPNICQGDANGSDAFNPSLEWINAGADVFTGLGTHLNNCSGSVVVSSANSITGFDIAGVSANITGNIINVTVPFGTNLTSLSATGINSALSTVSPSFATLQDYSTAKTFTVTAQNMMTNVYTVNVVANSTRSSANSITGFTLQGNYPAVITGNMINVTVPFGTNITNLSATGTNSLVSTVSPSFATLLNYSTAKTFTVTAQNLATNVYTVNVTIAASVSGVVVPYLSLSTLRASLNASGITTITGQFTTSGQIYGINAFTGGQQYSLIDATGAITIRTALTTPAMAEGDMVTVTGGFIGTANAYGNFNGLLQVGTITNITIGTKGNARKTPTMVTALTEQLESDFVNVVANVSKGSWIDAPTAAFTAIMTVNGVATQLRISNLNTELYGKSFEDVFGVSVDAMNVTIGGLVGQFQRSSISNVSVNGVLVLSTPAGPPFNAGYQLMPYRAADILRPSNTPVSVSTASVQTSTITVYPNPAANVVYLSKTADITLADVAGRIIAQDTQVSQLNIGQLNKGLYILTINGTQRIKIIKE